MEAIWVSLGAALLVFVAGLVGLRLRNLLPSEHGPDKARDMIGAMTGLVGLLLALVLGTLVGSSYTIYATQKAELETLAARVLQLDEALENYGPEAAPGRFGMHAAIIESYNQIWGAGANRGKIPTLGSAVEGSKILDRFLMSLQPKTDTQRQSLATANFAAGLVNQTRMLMILQLANGISWPMITIVVIWSVLLFCGYGLISASNRTALVVLTLGALSVASAMFMIIELGEPYAGWFQLPPTGMQMVIQAFGS